MKKVISLLVLLLAFQFVEAQDKVSQYLGIRPYFTVEPYYEEGEFDINVFPLVYQNNISRLMSIRLASIFNYTIRKEGQNISHVGLQAAFPFYLKKRELRNDNAKGLYLAPVISLTRNLEEAHTNTGVYLEPGYHVEFSDLFSMVFGLELGATYFDYDDAREDGWDKHFGVSIILAWSLKE